jgi:hypothetical protein
MDILVDLPDIDIFNIKCSHMKHELHKRNRCHIRIALSNMVLYADSRKM